MEVNTRFSSNMNDYANYDIRFPHPGCKEKI